MPANNTTLVFFIYFAFVALLSVAVTVADKKAAIRRHRRVPEKTLFTIAWLGGALPMFLTMMIVRHKTRHKRFMIGLPAIFLFHLVAIGAFLFFSHGSEELNLLFSTIYGRIPL